ncbi:TraR/DksA family transcriptional regulator [Lutimaribacter marinistellae]|uniref:TraR/DksA family transcriptional regulator n=1 Tax=Lutimaribacter marinistellae TaxID=1820329 RepID=A0ABV7TKJ7_9RHOB
MNETELAAFSRLISDRLRELEQSSEAGRDGQSVVTLDQQAVGRLSRMDALQNQAMAKAQQTRRDTETVRLLAALERIEEGDFGYCEDCGEEIAKGRLELDPAATRCVSCASG